MISFKLRSLNLQRWICCSFDYQVKLWKALIGNVKWVFGSSYLASSFYSNRALRNTSILVFFASMHFSMLSQSSIEVLVDKTDILTCETLQYTLKYSCAGTGNNCPNVTMTASAPTGIIFPSQNIGITSDIQSYSFSADRRSVTFVFYDPLIAGHTGIITVLGQGECGLPEGSSGNVTGEIFEDGNLVDSGIVNTTLHSDNQFCPLKLNTGGLAVGDNTFYEVRLNFAGLYGESGTGTTSVTDVVMVDNLPANTIINSFTVESNSGIGAISLPPNTCVVDNTPSAPKLTCTFPNNTFDVISRFSPHTTVKLNVTYPSGSFNSGDNVTNNISVSYKPVGGTTIVAGPTITYQSGPTLASETTQMCTPVMDVTNTLEAPNSSLDLDKNVPGGKTTLKPGETINYELSFGNNGNITLTNVVVEDIVPAGLLGTSVNKPSGFVGLTGSETITYWVKTNVNTTYYQVMLNANDYNYSPPVGEYITAYKIEVSSMPPNSQIKYAALFVELDPNNSAASIQNCFLGSTTTPNTTVSNACNTLTILPPDTFSTLTMSKWLGYAPNSQYAVFYGAPQIIGTTVWNTLHLTNVGGGIDLENPVVMDLLPLGLTYDGVVQYGTSSCNLPQASTTEIIPNYNGTGRTMVRLSWSTAWPAGCDAWLSIKTIVNSYGIAGNAGTHDRSNPYEEPIGAKNSAFFTGSTPTQCLRQSIYNPTTYYETEDIYDLDGDNQTSGDTLCFASDYVAIASSAQLTSVKWVKGECDTEYTKYPASGMTMPGGLANYKLIITNNGNVPANDVVIVDILPYVGDIGVVDISPRSTEWRPNLVTPVLSPSGVTVYYSTSDNPCRNDFVPSGPSGCTAPNWSTILPTDPTTIQSLKIDFGTLVLNPGDQLELTWDMRAPVGAPANGEIAWNSFGYKATRVDNNDPFLPAEPFKVGIATKANQPGNYGNFVWCDANNNGLQDIGELGIDGVRVELYLDNGDNIAFPAGDQLVAFTSTGNGGAYLFPGLEPGNYYAVFYLPAGTLTSPVNVGTNDGIDSDGMPTIVNKFRVAITEITTIDASETDLSWDLGLDCDARAAIGNYVWFDENQNNIQDEPSTNGVNGVQVNLYNGSGALIATTFTGVDIYGLPGYYIFDDLDAGDYYLEFVLNNGQSFTPSTGSAGGSASDAEDSDANVTSGLTSVTTLVDGEVDLTWDAGIIIPTGIYNLGNFVWFDTNNNGIYDIGEVGVNNVAVELYNDYNNDGMPQPNEFVETTVTITESGINGIYNFENLPAGNYIVLIPQNSLSGPLLGYTNSTGNGVAPDPDDNVENDDNGSPLAGYGVVSKPITLGNMAEPLDNGYTNHSVDFGFFPTPVCNLTLNCSFTDPTCGNANGTAAVAISGATGSYSIMWSNGSNNNTISNLAAGIYSVEVTDDICTRSCTVQLTDQSGITASSTATNNTYCTTPSGTATVSTNADQVLWSNGSTTPTITGLSAGTYSVTVTDTNTGCTNTCQVQVIDENQLPSCAITVVSQPSCALLSGGSLTVNPNPIATYSYLWNTGATDQTLNNLTGGAYTVTVTNTNTNCSAVCQGSLDIPTNCCSIDAIVPQNVLCFDNNTPDLTTDNRIRFSANIQNTNIALTSFNVSVNGGTSITPNTNVAYGTTEFTLGPGTAGGGSTFIITIVDSASPNCTQTFQIVDPGGCSNTTECPTPKCGNVTFSINGN